MDTAAILREIDAEIEKLTKIREIMAGLAVPVRRTRKKPRARKKPQTVLPPEPQPQAPEPRLVVLPPVRKREYRPRTRTVAHTPGALAGVPSERPVFVPRAVASAVVEPTLPSPAMTPDQMEAAIRQNLLGGAA